MLAKKAEKQKSREKGKKKKVTTHLPQALSP